MKYYAIFILSFVILISCDHVENPYPEVVSIELDTTLYPGNWQDYIDNDWPQFNQNSNTNRNVIIEDFTGHKCVYCPAAADFAHQLHEDNPYRVFVASIHAGPTGMGDFQTISPPDYPTDFTNPNGLEIGEYFGINDGGFVGNPRGTVNRVNNGVIFQSPAVWSSMVSDVITTNDLKVNLQSELNYYYETNGAFLHVEVDKIDQTISDDLGLVVYLLEDSLVGDQKMSDNSHNTEYIHRDIHRKNISGQAFGRILQDENIENGKYLLNYSFKVPTQLDDSYNAENMHLLIYVYNTSTWEIYQVIKQDIVP
jgi:hypothetical protein